MLLGKSLRRLRAFVFPLPTTSSLSRSSAAPFPGRGLESLRSPPRRRVVVPAPACDSRPAHLAAAPTVPPIAECYESPRDSAAPTRPSVRVRRPCSANGTVGVVGGRESRSAGPSRGEGQTTHPPPPRPPDRSHESGAAELPRGVRGRAQQANQSGVVRQLCLSVHGQLAYRSGRLSVGFPLSPPPFPVPALDRNHPARVRTPELVPPPLPSSPPLRVPRNSDQARLGRARHSPG